MMQKDPVRQGLTARMDNAGLNLSLVGQAQAALARPLLHWEVAGPSSNSCWRPGGVCGNCRPGSAVAHGRDEGYWVLQNDWSGFPDPSEFVLVGFRDQGEIFALGFFEDWPGNWSVPAGLEQNCATAQRSK